MAHRNEYDVTNHIVVTDVESVRTHVCELYRSSYGDGKHLNLISQAFTDFDRLFSGEFDGYHACDTLYHDLQHTLDVTLAMARLLNGHEREHSHDPLGSARFTLGCIIALFHDAGYIRRLDDHVAPNGAYYTLTHVSRSGEFLRQYLPTVGLARYAALAAQLVHFTGYEVDINDIEIPDPKDRLLGHLLGTADLIAQMADRCYLEKCQHRLYPEFVVCGLAGKPKETIHASETHRHGTLFESPEDLLEKTPDFYNHSVAHRLNRHFHRAYNYAKSHFGDGNPYMERIQNNIRYLETCRDTGSLGAKLRRRLPDNHLQHTSLLEMVG